jgi:hypothetical protein
MPSVSGSHITVLQHGGLQSVDGLYTDEGAQMTPFQKLAQYIQSPSHVKTPDIKHRSLSSLCRKYSLIRDPETSENNYNTVE